MTRTEHERKIRIESARIAPVPLSSLICEDCGNPKIMAVTPGQDAYIVSTDDISQFGVWPDDAVIVRAVPARGWCLACCIRRKWLMGSGPYEAFPCVS